MSGAGHAIVYGTLAAIRIAQPRDRRDRTYTLYSLMTLGPSASSSSAAWKFPAP